ncbi:MAG: alpha-amylase/4-alpha-glucanotransferase domain-containing protein [Thermodesulfobacteriota bacterium]
MIRLVLALHCHQPVGNFDKVFALAVEKSYRPLLELLRAHPGVKAGLHFSGPLLEWLEGHETGVLDLIGGLVDRGQVEMLSGGFFEPLLAEIPRKDALGQVEMMNEYLERRFGHRPTGFWLTERIWDPGLPAVLAGTGLEYTVVDDTHFYYAGLEPEEVFGYYVTEKAGHTLKILATPMVMRYMIPFKLVEDVIAHLRTWDEAGREVAVYGDDGEKFGLWPGTHEWVIKKGWLEKFLGAVEDNSDWLRTTTPGEYAASAQPLGRLYMPQASYEEMTEWALPPRRGRALEEMIRTLKNENRWETWRPFVRGGVWDNFLVKYEESNRLHKKMLFLSERAGSDREALEPVWRAQCNCAYWHGVFGGLYMGHLRRAVHENLVLAQERLNRAAGGPIEVLRRDYDKDGFEEIFIEGPSLGLGLAPAAGGGLFEVCHLKKGLNLSDVLTRRLEAYHHKLVEAVASGRVAEEYVASIHDIVKVKEEGLERYLVYDDHTRLSLLDRFFAAEVNPEDLSAGKAEEIGDFVRGRYETVRAGVSGDEAEVVLARSGRAGGAELALTKTVRAGRAPVVSVEYAFENRGPEQFRAMYACEFNLTLFSDEDERRYILAPENGRRREAYETGGEYGVTRLDFINGGDRLKATFGFSGRVTALFHPLLTVSMSEDGFEKTYQGTALYFLRPLNLSPGDKVSFTIHLELVDI